MHLINFAVSMFPPLYNLCVVILAPGLSVLVVLGLTARYEVINQLQNDSLLLC